MKKTSLCFATLIVLLSSTAALAAPNEFAPLLKAKKFAEVERGATAKLAREPNNADALFARTQAVLSQGNPARIPEAVGYAEQCVRANPAIAQCQMALGNALGRKAMNGGIMSAMGYAGDIRNAFKKAVELEPGNFDARFSLLQYYVMAPAIVGGGSGKAADLAAQTAAIHPEAGKMMQAVIELDNGNAAQAEKLALAARPGSNEDLQDQHESVLTAIASKYMSDKKLGDTERVLQHGARLYPESETVGILTARVRQEQGRHREALTLLDALLAKHPRSVLLYRAGQSQQALGEKAKAAASYEKALAMPGLNDKLKADAKAQLATLKG